MLFPCCIVSSVDSFQFLSSFLILIMDNMDFVTIATRSFYYSQLLLPHSSQFIDYFLHSFSLAFMSFSKVSLSAIITPLS